MGQKIIKNFKPIKGSHCSSTCITEAVRLFGKDVNETLIFGISSGLDFIYAKYPTFGFSRIVSGRTPMLETSFTKTIGHHLYWREGCVVEWGAIKEYIENDTPIFFLTDIFYLPFYNAERSNFAGHTISVVGYNDNKKILYVSDYISDHLFELQYNELIQAIENKKPPFQKSFQWMPFTIDKSFILNLDIKQLVINGINANAKSMLSPSNKRGVNAINCLAQEVIYFKDLPNWRNLCLQIYQSMEKIGTGGLGFRKMYHDFLLQARSILGKELKVSINSIESLEKHYKVMSRYFFLAARRGETKYLYELKDILLFICELERQMWKELFEATSLDVDRQLLN
ncbi:BtrH N-terminal domain-containing protein [Gracilibacillus caseinilyticus]|uniref:BtrH N-terminal domain-containing protein n=1 Tax=Gracilibacillus caseinilyticus TaxID=2932256 RepID=A0ABY4F068_9BACI|nr:BtrH N-terminal domain-containing protein [Gracilibacillus caseinilyticus]UOQ49503.1 BtrH N-terminal domain-containing protein [Gracilibacillus caseinilyticus]